MVGANGITEVLANVRQWHVETGDLRRSLMLLPDACVHSVITSPPYFKLRSYLPDEHPDKHLEIGNESTPEQYIANMVAAFSEVRRVLHESGTVWLNLGDSYANSGKGGNPDESEHRKQATNVGSLIKRSKTPNGFKPKDMLGIPFRVAFALQANGWYLRSIIPWIKRNPMPESVTDRPSSAVEYVFLLAKSERYFYDAEAVKVRFSDERNGNPGNYTRTSAASKGANQQRQDLGFLNGGAGWNQSGEVTGRNRRNSDAFFESWQGLYEEDGNPLGLIVNPAGFAGAHFATFPAKLVQPMLAAGTSERGACSECGEPWRRIVKSERLPTRPGDKSKVFGGTPNWAHTTGNRSEVLGNAKKLESEITGNRDPERHVTSTRTTGWEAGCKCNASVVPCLALDIFNGAGTVGLVAKAMGRRYIGTELFEDYAEMARRRIDRGLCEDAPKQPKSVAGQRDLFEGATA